MTEKNFPLEAVHELLQAEELQVINLGLDLFGQTLEQLEIPVIEVDWRPPAGGDDELADILSALQG